MQNNTEYTPKEKIVGGLSIRMLLLSRSGFNIARDTLKKKHNGQNSSNFSIYMA